LDDVVVAVQQHATIRVWVRVRGGTGMGAAGFPTLDLTSGMAAGEPSGSQPPRPRKYSICLGDQISLSIPVSGASQILPIIIIYQTGRVRF
jgi:hypothetical protein